MLLDRLSRTQRLLVTRVMCALAIDDWNFRRFYRSRFGTTPRRVEVSDRSSHRKTIKGALRRFVPMGTYCKEFTEGNSLRILVARPRGNRYAEATPDLLWRLTQIRGGAKTSIGTVTNRFPHRRKKELPTAAKRRCWSAPPARQFYWL